MFCTQCGRKLDDVDRYCSQCGFPTALVSPTAGPPKRLMRSRYDSKIAGVCGGFAEYFEVDPTLVRLLWLIFIFFPIPGGLLAYIIAWIVLPKEPAQLPAPQPVTVRA